LPSRAPASGIEVGVSTRDELVERVWIRERRQTHTEGRLGASLRQVSLHFVKPALSTFDVAARKRAEELVASVADDKVVGPQAGSQRHRHFAEQLVAGSVALHVIDRLETVDVDEGENESPSRATGPVDLPLQIDQPPATLKRSGQDINACLLAVAGGLVAVARGFDAVAGGLVAGQGCQLVPADRSFLGRALAFLGYVVAFGRLLSIMCGARTITRTRTSVAGCLLVLADRALVGRSVTFRGDNRTRAAALSRAPAALSRSSAMLSRSSAMLSRRLAALPRSSATLSYSWMGRCSSVTAADPSRPLHDTCR
jgi:hypothetical protein